MKPDHPYQIDGPDSDSFVWLNWTDPGGAKHSLNLGSWESVSEAFADWLGQAGFGEGGPARAKVEWSGPS